MDYIVITISIILPLFIICSIKQILFYMKIKRIKKFNLTDKVMKSMFLETLFITILSIVILLFAYIQAK
jgi:hypothetical protein